MSEPNVFLALYTFRVLQHDDSWREDRKMLGPERSTLAEALEDARKGAERLRSEFGRPSIFDERQLGGVMIGIGWKKGDSVSNLPFDQKEPV